LRVTVSSEGRATAGEYQQDTVGSSVLAANLYWNALDAHYPPTAARYVFSYELRH
jgi:hypothetical protein